ncbi:Lectin-like protein [Linum grandiflorum]
MAIPHFKLLPFLLFFHFNLLLADPVTHSFSFTNFHKDPNFDSTLSLYGDANASPAHIRLSGAGSQVMYNKPIKLLQGSSTRDFTSFSTYFSFMIPTDSVLSLILVPSVEFNASNPFRNNRLNWTGIVAVEFGALNDAKYGDLEKGRFFSLKLRHYPSARAMLSSGKRLHAWVDCWPGSNRLEVRLSESGEAKPAEPLGLAQIGFSRIWSMWSSSDDEVMIGLSSSSSNASESCFLYSWSFQMRSYPHWMHSQPLDPNGLNPELKPVVDVRRGDYVMRVIAALLLGVGCGALGAFMGVNLCTMVSKRRLEDSSPSSSCSSAVHPVDFEYEKVKVVVVDTKVFEDDHGKESNKDFIFELFLLGSGHELMIQLHWFAIIHVCSDWSHNKSQLLLRSHSSNVASKKANNPTQPSFG